MKILVLIKSSVSLLSRIKTHLDGTVWSNIIKYNYCPDVLIKKTIRINCNTIILGRMSEHLLLYPWYMEIVYLGNRRTPPSREKYIFKTLFEVSRRWWRRPFRWSRLTYTLSYRADLSWRSDQNFTRSPDPCAVAYLIRQSSSLYANAGLRVCMVGGVIGLCP